MEELLQELAKSNKVLVAGSWARGEQNENSDLDFFVKTPKHCILFGDRNENIDWIITLLKKYNVTWNSSRTSYISTIGEKNNLPIQLEFYEGFFKNKNRLKEVEIKKIKFKTI